MFQQQPQQEEPSVDIDALVKRLNSKVPKERQEAENALRIMGPDAVVSLLDVIRREQRAYLQRQCVVLLVPFLGLSLTGLLLIEHFGLFPEHTELVANLQLGGWLALCGVSLWSGATRSHRNAARALSLLNDIRAVGPLAEALVLRNGWNLIERGLNSAAESALIRLLPRLRASDALLLNRGQRRCLNMALRGTNEVLILAILKAYEQVGDATAIPSVKRLADRGRRTGEDAQISQAARTCLPFLEQRAEQQEVSQTLLRASTPEDQPETLLRTVIATPDADPADQQELLRANDFNWPAP